jgi:hypothetical protein
MSTPCSRGRQRAGEAVVLSTTTGTRVAVSHGRDGGQIGNGELGIAIVSRKMTLVRSVMAASNEAASSASTHTAWMPGAPGSR